MKPIVIKIDEITSEILNNREWLVTNGIGGFACGSIGGAPMRKYHSLLSAALPAPYGRTIMLNYVIDELIVGDNKIPLSLLYSEEYSQKNSPLKEFRLENGIPYWVYEVGGVVLEKSLFLINRQNTLCISYRLISSETSVEIKWRPFFHFRMNEQAVNTQIPNEAYGVHINSGRYEISCPEFPVLKIYNEPQAAFTTDFSIIKNVYYEIEEKRGYAFRGDLKSPGFLTLPLKPMERSHIVASTEPWDVILTLAPRDAKIIEKVRKRKLLKMAGPLAKQETFAAKLVLAADQFLMVPTTRYQDMIRLHAAGEEVKSIIAGFPWFTDWGRDTMISLEGLTLCTGRSREAYAILNTFSHYIRDGLIPNMFPDGDTQGIYNTADATLWFFHAVDRYLTITNDEDIMEFLLPKLHEIIQNHIKGTKFGIRMDVDGLLIQGEEGYQLTWMDAKVGDWVVTPRRGKAVEINALWYNALKLYESWTGKKIEFSQLCYESFNNKFWYEQGQYLYDIVEGADGNDSALRPNQLFAISLINPVLKPEYWECILNAVEKDLFTPVGLRTLSPSHPNYRPFYEGDLHARDAAYHQGTIWPWLIGPFIDVLLKVHPEDVSRAKEILNGLEEHLNSNCIGSIAEIFDASSPYHARGCFAQAWSVAELLRCLTKVKAAVEK